MALLGFYTDIMKKNNLEVYLPTKRLFRKYFGFLVTKVKVFGP